MVWKKRYSRATSTKRAIIKKLERREKMAKVHPRLNHSKPLKKAEISEEQHFVLRNGAHLKNIEELARLMDHMEDDDFSFHVNEEKNDFANWVGEVFKEKELAEELNTAKDRKHCHIALLRHVAFGKK